MRAEGTALRGAKAACAITLIVGAILLAWAPKTMAELSFCPPGTGAGHCEHSAGIATDFETGHVYVADEGNNRIDVFEANGTFLLAFGWKVNATTPEEKLQTCTAVTECQKGSAGSGAGQFKSPKAVAVDNSSGAAKHDLYVFTPDHRVQRFGPAGEFKLGFGWAVNAESPKEELQTCTAVTGCKAGTGGKGKCQI